MYMQDGREPVYDRSIRRGKCKELTDLVRNALEGRDRQVQQRTAAWSKAAA